MDDSENLNVVQPSPRPAGCRRTLAYVVFGSLALLLAAGLLLPAVRTARPAASRMACSNQLKQIGLALQTYQQQHGFFPPAFTTDRQGRRLHSWRTLILPYLEEQAVYERVDLSRPWDHPVNQAARRNVPSCYRCPGTTFNFGETTYLGCVGDHAAFGTAGPRTLDEFTDAHSRTVIVVEVPPKMAVHWMSPEDADRQTFVEAVRNTKTNHPGGQHGLMGDWTPRFIGDQISDQLLEALFTIDGGEADTALDDFQ